jgi:hypothetical protein
MFELLNRIKQLVKEEINHIPRGDIAQNFLRMNYWPVRMSSLKGGKENKTKEQVLSECIKLVKINYHDFKPMYDKKFFKL